MCNNVIRNKTAMRVNQNEMSAFLNRLFSLSSMSNSFACFSQSVVFDFATVTGDRLNDLQGSSPS